MSQLAVDPVTGGLLRVNGQLTRVEGTDEILQSIRIRLRLFAEEVPLNLSLGLQYTEIIFARGSSEAMIEGEYRSQIEETPGVVEVGDISLDLDAATRVLSVDWSGKISIDALRDTIPVADALTIKA